MAIVKNFFESIGALALLFVVFLVATFPVTWLLMLFLGNVGAALSYWAVLPLGVVVSLLIGAGSSGGYKYGRRSRQVGRLADPRRVDLPVVVLRCRYTVESR